MSTYMYLAKIWPKSPCSDKKWVYPKSTMLGWKKLNWFKCVFALKVRETATLNYNFGEPGSQHCGPGSGILTRLLLAILLVLAATPPSNWDLRLSFLKNYCQIYRSSKLQPLIGRSESRRMLDLCSYIEKPTIF